MVYSFTFHHQNQINFWKSINVTMTSSRLLVLIRYFLKIPVDLYRQVH